MAIWFEINTRDVNPPGFAGRLPVFNASSRSHGLGLKTPGGQFLLVNKNTDRHFCLF